MDINNKTRANSCSHLCVLFVPECDVRIRSTGGSSGTFNSPGYPLEFPKNTVCRFFLDGEMNAGRLEKVKVTFKDFSISGDLDK